MDKLTESIEALAAAIAYFRISSDIAYADGNNYLGNVCCDAANDLQLTYTHLVNSTEHLPRLIAKATAYGLTLRKEHGRF